MLVKTMVMLQKSGDFLKDINANQKDKVDQNMPTVHNLWQLVELCLLLFVILIAAYYTSKFVGRWKLGEMQSSNFQLVDTYRIGPNKMLQIVKVANKFLVISVGKDAITFVAELDESEVIIRDKNKQQNVSFTRILDKIKNGKEADDQ
jgi:flagellar protein FliO/FliZ